MFVIKKSRYWLSIIYPESAPSNFREIFKEHGISYVLSPLHEFDVDDSGEIKKPHYHCLFCSPGPTTFEKAKEVFSLVCGVGCITCYSPFASVQYFCHLNSPDKYQYDFDDIEWSGVGMIDVMGDDGNFKILCEVFNWCESEHNYSYHDLCLHVINNEPLWRDVVFKIYRESIWKFLRSYQYSMEKLSSSVSDGDLDKYIEGE